MPACSFFLVWWYPPPPQPFNACLVVCAHLMVPTPHHDMSMLVCSVSHIWSCPPPRPFNACLFLLAHFVVPLPRPSNACLLVLVHLVAPTTHHVLSVSACLIFLPHLLVPHHDLSVSACWLFLPCLLVPPHHDLSMLVGSLLHIWWRQPPTTTFQ